MTMTIHLAGFCLQLVLIASSSAKVINLSPWQGNEPVKSRIVGGSNASEGAYPYMAALKRDFSFICGASIVSNNFILTAAHCVHTYLPSQLLVFTDTNNIITGGDYYVVFDIFIHEKFDPFNIKYDIAGLLLPSITFKDNVKPIVLDFNYIGGGVKVKLSGWGAPNKTQGTVEFLKHIDLLTISEEECKNRHNETVPSVNESEICTFTKYGEGICFGDSGSPLVRVHDNGHVTQIGIASWCVPCGIGYPDVYNRISSILSWFESVLQ